MNPFPTEYAGAPQIGGEQTRYLVDTPARAMALPPGPAAPPTHFVQPRLPPKMTEFPSQQIVQVQSPQQFPPQSSASSPPLHFPPQSSAPSPPPAPVPQPQQPATYWPCKCCPIVTMSEPKYAPPARAPESAPAPPPAAAAPPTTPPRKAFVSPLPPPMEQFMQPKQEPMPQFPVQPQFHVQEMSKVLAGLFYPRFAFQQGPGGLQKYSRRLWVNSYARLRIRLIIQC